MLQSSQFTSCNVSVIVLPIAPFAHRQPSALELDCRRFNLFFRGLLARRYTTVPVAAMYQTQLLVSLPMER
jgi:hypothetical protein